MAKSKKIVLFVLIATLVLSLGLLSFTTAKYVLEAGNSQSNIGDDGDIPYALLNKIEVTSQEDLFSALENGYPYVVLSDRVRDPLIVTQETMDVKKSLVLDLNGKRLERISSNAMLNVPEGVTLTIIDSGKDGEGGLYNPVGTVLQISGGSLKVRGGKYESGPRTWEYASYTANNRISNGEVQDVQYHAKNATTNEIRSMPIINPTITMKEDGTTIKSVDGNVYFDVAYQQIPADTYCYYVTSDNFTSGITVGLDYNLADFSYTYYAKKGTYEYMGAEEPTEEHVQVMVYGFEKDIQTAMGRADDATVSAGDAVNLDKAPWYAAVKMENGLLTINSQGSPVDLTSANYKNEHDYNVFSKGSFISYFGVETASCVQFTGGNMTVSTDGVFATVNPETISKINPNALSSEGRGICVHNNGNGTGDGGTLTITKGKFLSYNMSLVRLQKGTCFVKDSMCYRVHNTDYYKKEEGYTSGTGTLYSAGGNIEVNNTQFWVSSLKEYNDSDQEMPTGSTDSRGTYGIYSAGGEISLTNSVVHMSGDACRGIYTNPIKNTDPDAKATSEGDVRLYNTLVYVAGDRTFGIYSRGGTVSIDADAPTTENGVKTYNSRFFITGKKIMGVFANLPKTPGKDAHAVIMKNTRIRVNTSDGVVNEAGDFNVAINSINASLSFSNISIESGAYGVTTSEGDIHLQDCTINTKDASAIIVKDGTITAKGAIDINCNVTKNYVDNVPNIWRGSSGEHNYLRTYVGIDIQNGLLNVLKDETLTENHFRYTFNTDVVTPETKDRIGEIAEDGTTVNNLPYVANGGINSQVFETSGQMKASSAMLPAAMAAVRVDGIKGSDALNINSNCTITAKVGGGILVRDGNVNLGDEGEQFITVETQGTEYHQSVYHFMGKDYWDYRDTKTGGNAMFVSGGNVVSKATNLTLKSALGNGLFVTGADIRPDADMRYKGEITLADGITTPSPTVTIDAGTFIGNATDAFINDNKGHDTYGVHSSYGCRWGFHFTGPSSFYGVKVVCGGKAEINGGTFEGYGAVCTMGAITQTAVPAHLIINGDYRNESDRITMSGKRDVACFYNASDVTINSYDNPNAGISTRDCSKIPPSDKKPDFINGKKGGRMETFESNRSYYQYEYKNATDFGVAIPNGANTAIVIESYSTAFGTNVTINGGYYRAIYGDEGGAKAIWCSNTNAQLTINGGYFIGNELDKSYYYDEKVTNEDGSEETVKKYLERIGRGGAIQQSQRLKELTLNGGYFFNCGGIKLIDDENLSGHILTGSRDFTLGEGKTIYKLNGSGEYFTKSVTAGSIWDSAIYIPYTQTPPEDQQPQQ